MSGTESSTPTKICTKCGRMLPVAAFSRNKRSHDGLQLHCKECCCAATKRWKKANRERANAQSLEWQRTEKGRAWRQEYMASHREEIAANHRAYYLAHREEALEKAREYRASHREEIAAKDRAYRRAHAEKMCVKDHNYRARKRGTSGTHTIADIAAQYERQRGKCYWCGEKVGERYHTDHVTPLSKGGSNGPENLVISCSRCNLNKNDTHPMDWAGCLF